MNWKPLLLLFVAALALATTGPSEAQMTLTGILAIFISIAILGTYLVELLLLLVNAVKVIGLNGKQQLEERKEAATWFVIALIASCISVYGHVMAATTQNIGWMLLHLAIGALGLGYAVVYMRRNPNWYLPQ